MKARWKKIGKWLLRSSLILLITLLLLECCYRCDVIDFYSAELKGLNSEETLNDQGRKRFLVFGDSFSAMKKSYVALLQDSLQNWNVINSSVPGCCFRQTRIFFKDRIEEFKPDAVLIQIYVGNDLQDYHHVRNWSTLSMSRNIYSLVTNRLLSVRYLNYKLGGLSSKSDLQQRITSEKFDWKIYNPEEKRFLLGNPSSLNNALMLEGDEKSSFDELLSDIKHEVESLEIPVYLLIIPHHVQVNEDQRNNLRSNGAKLSDEIKLGKFPFFDETESYFNELDHVQVICPLMYFNSLKEKDSLYYVNDPHLNEFGQEKLYEFVRKRCSGLN